MAGCTAVALLSAPVTQFMFYHSSCFVLCPHIHSQLLFYYLFLYFLPPYTVPSHVNPHTLLIAVALFVSSAGGLRPKRLPVIRTTLQQRRRVLVTVEVVLLQSVQSCRISASGRRDVPVDIPPHYSQFQCSPLLTHILSASLPRPSQQIPVQHREGRCHRSGIQKLQVASRFLEYLCTVGIGLSFILSLRAATFLHSNPTSAGTSRGKY